MTMNDTGNELAMSVSPASTTASGRDEVQVKKVMEGCKEDPRKVAGSGCDKWGGQRVALAKVCENILNNFHKDDKSLYPYFIENGTLLGAMRSGKFIPHDDDFDFAILLNSEFSDAKGISEEMDSLLAELQSKLPSPYKSRRVSTYADKIEVYDPSH